MKSFTDNSTEITRSVTILEETNELIVSGALATGETFEGSFKMPEVNASDAINIGIMLGKDGSLYLATSTSGIINDGTIKAIVYSGTIPAGKPINDIASDAYKPIGI